MVKIITKGGKMQNGSLLFEASSWPCKQTQCELSLGQERSGSKLKLCGKKRRILAPRAKVVESRLSPSSLRTMFWKMSLASYGLSRGFGTRFEFFGSTSEGDGFISKR